MLPRRRSTSRRSSLPNTDPPAVSPAAVAPGEAERSLTTPGENELPAINEKIELLNRETDPGIVATPLEHKPGAPKDVHSIDQPDNLGKAKAPTAKKPADELLVKNQDAVGDIKEKFTASKSSPIWDRYVKMTEEEDRDVLEDWEGAIDITLVFAALFSAISTGFVLESSKSLQPDPTVATVLAIQELTSVVQAGLQATRSSSPQVIVSPSASFQPSTVSVWVNGLWFFSLGLSISVSLFAMLAKRWCYKYRSKHSGTPYERALRRQEAWDTLQEWKLELLIEQLPTIMHVALMTFFVGLVLYLSEIHVVTMIVTAVPIGLTILAYVALTALPVWSPTFPMVTPFTRILQAGSWYYINKFCPWVWSYVLKSRCILHSEEWIHALHTVGPAITRLFTRLHASIYRNQSHTTAIRSLLVSEQWVLSGCSQPVGKTLSYPRSGEQQYAFRALMWVLQNSNEKTRIDEVLEYIETFPEVVLDSSASSQALCEATLTIAGHFQRLKHDPVEYHDLNTTRFQAKCGRFMYLNALPWLHSASSADGTRIQGIYDFWSTHYPYMSPEEVQDHIKDILKQPYNPTTCIPWLERQAIQNVLGCPPEGGFLLCRELSKWATSKLPTNRDQEEIYSTLSWMLLNLTIDATSSYSDGVGFWPSLEWLIPAPSEDGRNPPPVARCDSALTLSYFRHSDKRKGDSRWLNVVGLSGVLNIPTYYPSEDIEPDVEANSEFYAGLIQLLRTTLALASQLPSADEADPYFGKLPVYWESDIRLYEFDSLHYCFDALERASRYPRFAKFHKELNELKDMIPETRRGQAGLSSKSEVDVAGSVVQALPEAHAVGDTMV